MLCFVDEKQKDKNTLKTGTQNILSINAINIIFSVFRTLFFLTLNGWFFWLVISSFTLQYYASLGFRW